MAAKWGRHTQARKIELIQRQNVWRLQMGCNLTVANLPPDAALIPNPDEADSWGISKALIF
jgi:hypothetical protein